MGSSRIQFNQARRKNATLYLQFAKECPAAYMNCASGPHHLRPTRDHKRNVVLQEQPLKYPLEDYRYIAVFAACDIARGAELLLDYGKEWWDDVEKVRLAAKESTLATQPPPPPPPAPSLPPSPSLPPPLYCSVFRRSRHPNTQNTLTAKTEEEEESGN
jgi:hypothetical protein